MRTTTKVLAALLGAGPLLLLAPVASAAPPRQHGASFTFVDLNPCTGLDHTVTLTFAVSEIARHGLTVAHAKRTVTTEPTGFVGRGTDSFVDNGQTVHYTQTDILTNPAGEKIRVSSVFVIDAATETIKVERTELTCLGEP